MSSPAPDSQSLNMSVVGVGERSEAQKKQPRLCRSMCEYVLCDSSTFNQSILTRQTTQTSVNILSSSSFRPCRLKHFRKNKDTNEQYQIIINISNRQLALEAECSMTIWNVTKGKRRDIGILKNALIIWK